MTVYDVTSANDTQRNIHLTDHHTLGVKTGHSHQALHRARLGTLVEKNATAARRHMSIARLAQLRVARYFIKTMRPFSHCEDASYREQASPDWVSCARDTMRGTIGECFLVAAQQVKLAINSAARRAVLAFLHLNADLWTSKVNHQKFLGVRIFWKSGPELQTTFLAVTSYVPPKGEDKTVSEWFLEYVLEVIKWYGVDPSHVKGATSDAGSDCKKVLHKLAQEHGLPVAQRTVPHLRRVRVFCSEETKNRKVQKFIYPQKSICGKIATLVVQVLPTSPSGAQPVTIMTLGGGGI
jgi:hypothetical protein